ncbi:hypothetical protein ABZS66_52990 [Dactylosporangium sp. NPDC005572]|uniref:hypothetical protein n=1 Tax=Dactylosporangium sp. NPDC005572 TaxID=3156889 RepID=UPI0033AB48E9
MPKALLRLGLAALAGIATAALAAPAAFAGPAAPALTDRASVPVSLHESGSGVVPLSAGQYRAARAAAGRPLAADEAARLAASACWSYTRSRWAENAFGGTLYRISGTVNWCQDGRTVWGGSNSWSTSTGYGWYFDKWTNAPTGYYNPARTRYDTVAQAKFCLAWCGAAAYLGQDLWGNADGTHGASNL